MITNSKKMKSISRDSLVFMLDQSSEYYALWEDNELPSIFQHLVSTLLCDELEELMNIEHPMHDDFVSTLNRLDIKTFEDLIVHPHPPSNLLFAVKNHAKCLIYSSEQNFPTELAKALYTICILKSKQNGYDNTKLDDASIIRSARWCLAQRWMNDSVRKEIRNCLDLYIKTQ